MKYEEKYKFQLKKILLTPLAPILRKLVKKEIKAIAAIQKILNKYSKK